MTIDIASRIMDLRANLLSRSEALHPASVTPLPNFTDALTSVSKVQDRAGAISEAFERGDMTDIAQVMIARQKAAVAFEATIQVRNRLVGAYRDIMNMAV